MQHPVHTGRAGPNHWSRRHDPEPDPEVVCAQPGCEESSMTEGDFRQCDHCGGERFCDEHVDKIEDLYLCPEHSRCECGNPAELICEWCSEATCGKCLLGDHCAACDEQYEKRMAELEPNDYQMLGGMGVEPR